MVNDSLYTKYRPKKFYDVYGQKYISEILENQIKCRRFTHAYLFSGTRGTGKTTCARIFAKAINCLNNTDGNPCYECSMCNQENTSILNVIELDAASNNSVDQIKSLIEELRYSNFVGGYKVYILDEVHMLSMNAFNALLKTLEEPPKNVIFILSTTEIKKIPQTVVSRCQKFEFKNIEIQDIVSRLKYIADSEKINIDNESLELISYMGNGSMRDSISILERVLLYTENIKIENVREILGITSSEFIFELLKFIFEKDLHNGLKLINEIFEDGLDIRGFINSFRNILRDLIFLKFDKINCDLLVEKNNKNIDKMKLLCEKVNVDELTFIIDKINDINDRSFSSEIEYRIYLEMFMVKFCKKSFLTEVKHIKNNFEKPEVLDKNPNFNSNEEMVDLNVWKDFLDYLRKSSFMVLYSLLQNGSVQSFQNDKVLFKCNTIGIMNRLKNMNTIKQIEENLKSFFGKPLIFEVFSEMEQNDEAIEDRVKKVFGDHIEIENK